MQLAKNPRLLSMSLRAGGRREGGRPTTPALDRLQAFKAAFLADPRPGLVFDYGRLILANQAAKRLLGSAREASAFLEALKGGLARGRPDPGLCLQMGTQSFRVHVQPHTGRSSHTIRICFLVREAAIVPAFKALTDREVVVVTCLVKGSTNGEIAGRLGISIETVRKHVANALRKTGTRTRAGLVGRALR